MPRASDKPSGAEQAIEGERGRAAWGAWGESCLRWRRRDSRLPASLPLPPSQPSRCPCRLPSAQA